jgi:glucokinase
MRQLNLASVLRVIRTQGPLPRPELARATGLSTPTVKQLVEHLLAMGYVEESEPPADADRPRRPGPRARLLSFRATFGYVLAVDAGADNTVAKLADLSGDVLATARVPHPEAVRRDVVLAAIRKSVAQVLADSGVQSTDLRAVGIGTPGVVDPGTGRITLAPQIADWDGIDLASELSDVAECPIVIENEAHLSLLAEQWLGAARSHRNVVYIQLGIGIGAAILIDGQLYRGSSGAAGEIAYLVLEGDFADQPRDSAAGPFEWFAGGYAYRRDGAIAARSERGALLLSLAGGDPAAVTAQIVFDAAAAGDAAALDVTTEVLERVGRGVANIASILNPDLILLGGGITNAGDSVLDPIREAVRRFTPYPPAVELSALGSDGSVLGAIRRAIDVADETTFSFIAAND